MTAGGPGDDGRGEVRNALVELVRSRPHLAEDGDRLDGYLRDVCPHRPAETAVVVVAVRAGVRDELSVVSQGHAVEALSARLAGRLHTEFGIDEALARWAVDSWALALGVTRPEVGEVQPADEPPPPRRRDPSADENLRAMAARVAPVPDDSVTVAPPAAPVLDAPTMHPSPVAVEGATVHRKPAPVAAPVPPEPRRSWRTPALVGGGAVVVCLALVAVLVTANRDSPVETGRDAGPVVSTTSAPASTTPPTTPTTPAPTVTVAPKAFPVGPSALTPGTYTTSGLRPGLTAVVPDGWRINVERVKFLELLPAEGNGQVLSVVRPDRPFRRAAAFPTGAETEQASAVEPEPDDYVAWLGSHSRLSASTATPVIRGGIRGTQVDVTVRSPYTTDYCGPTPCVAMFHLDDGLIFSLFEGNRNRVYVFKVGDSQMLVVMEAPADRFQAFVDRADRIVETMVFR